MARAQPGTIEHWLTERYCLYSARDDGAIFRADIHHRPWPLQRARAEIRANAMLDPLGLSLDGDPPLLHYAEHIDVAVWGLERVA